ncbi:MAG: hypothetical protein Tsb009_16400 [Planctomycetaceae bacterium]
MVRDDEGVAGDQNAPAEKANVRSRNKTEYKRVQWPRPGVRVVQCHPAGTLFYQAESGEL